MKRTHNKSIPQEIHAQFRSCRPHKKRKRNTWQQSAHCLNPRCCRYHMGIFIFKHVQPFRGSRKSLKPCFVDQKGRRKREIYVLFLWPWKNGKEYARALTGMLEHARACSWACPFVLVLAHGLSISRAFPSMLTRQPWHGQIGFSIPILFCSHF